MKKHFFSLSLFLLFTQYAQATLKGHVVQEESTTSEILESKSCCPFGFLTLLVKEKIRYSDKEYKVLIKGVNYVDAINPFIRAEMDRSSYHGWHLNRTLLNIKDYEIPARLIFTRQGLGWFQLEGLILKESPFCKQSCYYSLSDIEILSKRIEHMIAMSQLSHED